MKVIEVISHDSVLESTERMVPREAFEWDYNCTCEIAKELRKYGCRPRCAEVSGEHFTGLFHPEISKVVQYE